MVCDEAAKAIHRRTAATLRSALGTVGVAPGGAPSPFLLGPQFSVCPELHRARGAEPRAELAACLVEHGSRGGTAARQAGSRAGTVFQHKRHEPATPR